MKLALNGATTMRADLLTDIEAAQAAGFDYLEIWASKLRDFLKQTSAADLNQLFLAHNIRPLSINSIEHITFRDAEAYQSIKQQCRELSSINFFLLITFVRSASIQSNTLRFVT